MVDLSLEAMRSTVTVTFSKAMRVGMFLFMFGDCGWVMDECAFVLQMLSNSLLMKNFHSVCVVYVRVREEELISLQNQDK